VRRKADWKPIMVYSKGRKNVHLRCRPLSRTRKHRQRLNLVVAAIAFWNTVYLERAINALQERSYVIDQKLLAHLSPLKWEYINLTGDYHWRRDGAFEAQAETTSEPTLSSQICLLAYNFLQMEK
jgi:hypothetical protein